jgi:hypothetical protein
VPTATLPNDTLVEFTESVAVPVPVDAATPVPLSATLTDEFDSELSAMVSWPVELPAAVGANCTVRVRVLFAAMVAGSVPAPLTVNVLPVTVKAEIATGLELELASASLVVAGVPTVTLPKATLPGVTVMLPALALGDPSAALLGVSPPHPEIAATETVSAANARRRDESCF